MNAENPTDVIEAVALAIGKHRHGSQEAWDEDRRLARALHDAGLLADPADRDVKARLIAHRNVLRRMNRAEAEVAELRAELRVTTNERDRARVYGRELRATVARVQALADDWEPCGRRPPEYMWASLRAALDGAGESK